MRTRLLLAVGAVLVGGCLLGPIDDDGGSDAGLPMGGEGYCGSTEDWDPAATELEARVVELVNQARSVGGDCNVAQFGPSGALTADPSLTCAARVHSLDMATRDFFDHVNPDGDDPFVRMEAAGYVYSAAGENIAAGQPTPDEVVAGWLASPGHCRNMLDPSFVHIGVGYVFTDGASYPHYWTQTFGAPL